MGYSKTRVGMCCAKIATITLPVSLLANSGAAYAQDVSAPIDNAQASAILKQLRSDRLRISNQDRQLKAQEQQINQLLTAMRSISRSSASQQTALEVPGITVPSLAVRPAISSPAQQTTAQFLPGGSSSPSPSQPTPVGQAPPHQDAAPEVQQLASVGGVLTRKGNLVVEPFVQYSHSSINSFTFEGVQIINAFLIGVINAGKSEDDLAEAGATFRYGVGDRFEIEARVPYVYRSDKLTGTTINQAGTTTNEQSTGQGVGDLEFAAHYQINSGLDDWPFLIANLRVKSATGSSPYALAYHSDGSSADLATGTGFLAISPSLTAIYPTDPAVLFANIGYIHSFGGHVNTQIGSTLISEVDPGDTISLSFGFGLAENERFSYTLGYEQDVVFGTSTVMNGVKLRSDTLEVGSGLLGVAFKVNPRTSINFDLAAGITRDAPDVLLTLRVPLTIGLFSDS